MTPGTSVIIELLGGIALLLWGVRMVRTGIMRAWGGRLKHFIETRLSNRFSAFLAGGAATFDWPWIAGNLVVGLALLVAAAVSNVDALRERMSSGEARRAGKYGTSAILSTLFVLAILGFLAFLSTRYHKRFDWSEMKVHSLTSQSQQLLEGLEQDVEVLALFPPLESEPVRELLDRYAYASPRFKVQYADPNERPELLARHGITPEQLGEGVVRVALGGESMLVDEVSEEKLTNALVKL